MAVNPAEALGAPGRNEFVGAFAKGIDVLKALGTADRPLTLSRLAEASGQSRASARRFALTLVHIGMAEQAEDGFRLLPGALRPDAAAEEIAALKAAATFHAGRMIDRFREASSFGRRDGDQIEILSYTRANRLMSMRLEVGDRLPLIGSAQGRVILAGLPAAEVDALLTDRADAAHQRAAIRATRDRGFALVDQELEQGVRSIALPVHGPRSGQVVAAMSLCAHSNRMSVEEMLAEGLTALRQAVAATEADAAARLGLD